MGSRDDELNLGAQPPSDYGERRELGNVFNNIASAKKRGETNDEKPEVNIEDDLEPNEIVQKPKVERAGYFVIDIETYRDTEMKEDYEEYCRNKTVRSKKIVQPAAVKKNREEAESKFALSPFTGQVILVGLLDDNGKVIQFGLDGSTEKVILQDAWRAINTLMNEGYRMISFNGKKFDIPYLFKRALINGVYSTPTVAINELTHPYNNFHHYDVFNVLGDEGSLERWNYLFGFGTEFQGEGNEIGKWYEEKKLDVIRQKNIADIRKTGRVYELLKDWVVG